MGSPGKSSSFPLHLRAYHKATRDQIATSDFPRNVVPFRRSRFLLKGRLRPSSIRNCLDSSPFLVFFFSPFLTDSPTTSSLYLISASDASRGTLQETFNLTEYLLKYSLQSFIPSSLGHVSGLPPPSLSSGFSEFIRIRQKHLLFSLGLYTGHLPSLPVLLFSYLLFPQLATGHHIPKFPLLPVDKLLSPVCFGIVSSLWGST